MNLPKEFVDRMQERLGENFPAFLASYEGPPRKGLRVNTLKISPEEFSRRAPFPLGDRVCDDPACFYIEEEKPGADPYHFAGLYYLQEPSAMTVGEIAASCGKARVLDLCAAPGGKTTHLAQLMAGKGILIANEKDYKRACALKENVERMGIANCAVTNAGPEWLSARFPAYFDLVLVDAPCSGEGMFKKEKNALPEWSMQNVARCAARQRDILREAAKTVALGGRLIYSTCTFAEEEDEWQIREFLKDHPAFALVSERKLYPHTFRGEGHYCAVLERRNGDPVSCPPPASGSGAYACPPPADGSGVYACPPPASGGGVGEGVRPHARIKPFPAQKNAQAERAFAAFAEDFFAESPQGVLTTLAGGGMYLVPADMPDLTGLPVLRAGVALGTWDGKLFKPAHALAMAFGAQARRKITLSREQAVGYLRGETLQADAANGWCVVCVEEFPLGLGKCVDGVVKNHLPKGLRLVKTV